MRIPEVKIERIKSRIRLYPDGRRSSWDVVRYPELNKNTLAVLVSNGAGSRYIKRGRIFHCKAGPEEQLRQEVIINTARACIDGTHEGGK
jgi:hypothetical protein